MFVPIDEAIQPVVISILSQFEKLVDTRANRSAGDPFVIALAQIQGCAVVTDEQPTRSLYRPNIPDVCRELKLPWLSLLQLIRNEGCKAGLVFNPATPLSYLDYVLDKVDMILLMSVNPGFGGQSFIPSAMDKLREVRKLIDASGRDIRLEIDGGVKADNIAEIKAAGADTFVSGSGIFGKGNPADPHRYDTLRVQESGHA